MEKIARSCREGGVVRRVENHGLSQHRRWLGSSGEAGWWLRLRGLQARASHFPPRLRSSLLSPPTPVLLAPGSPACPCTLTITPIPDPLISAPCTARPDPA